MNNEVCVGRKLVAQYVCVVRKTFCGIPNKVSQFDNYASLMSDKDGDGDESAT